jgi:glycine/D-amino acid oxidase-like deaminating enzyme
VLAVSLGLMRQPFGETRRGTADAVPLPPLLSAARARSSFRRSGDVLNAKAAECCERVLRLADKLEATALEWKLDSDVLDEIPMGLEEAAEIDPAIAYALPHAALVMDAARQLRPRWTAGFSSTAALRIL